MADRWREEVTEPREALEEDRRDAEARQTVRNMVEEMPKLLWLRGHAADVGNGHVGGGGVSTSLLAHASALRARGFSIIPIPRAAGGLDGD